MCVFYILYFPFLNISVFVLFGSFVFVNFVLPCIVMAMSCDVHEQLSQLKKDNFKHLCWKP